MRIRSGFVSNSSSSSFIAVVVKYPKDLLTDDLADTLDVYGFNIMSDSEDGWSDPKTMVVGDVMTFDDDYMASAEWTPENLMKIWDNIEEKMGVVGERLVISGTKMT